MRHVKPKQPHAGTGLKTTSYEYQNFLKKQAIEVAKNYESTKPIKYLLKR